MKITRVRIYKPKRLNPTFNQSDMVVTVETDAGVTGVGEGGSRDTLEQCGAMLIGEDPGRIQHLWQMMYRGFFYPPGREKLHALGGLDLALWDIKGKALGAPVYELLGGRTRDYVECYSTGFPWQGTLAETARACIAAGFRAFRTAVADPADGVFHARRMVDRWDINELIERRLLDYARVTLPNVGGITEWMKIAAICETHYVGLVPHFTGPIALAALVQVLCALPVPALMEIAGPAPKQPPHLARGCTFRDGKLWPEPHPGLGIEFDPAGADLIAEITEHNAPIPQFRRPDGSVTNW